MPMGRVFVGVLLLLATGCATNSSVREQIQPVSHRVIELEQKVSSLEKLVNQSLGNSEAARRSAEEVKSAMIKAEQGAKESATRAEAAAASSESAVTRAENSATRADDASKQAIKAFELQQRK